MFTDSGFLSYSMFQKIFKDLPRDLCLVGQRFYWLQWIKTFHKIGSPDITQSSTTSTQASTVKLAKKKSSETKFLGLHANFWKLSTWSIAFERWTKSSGFRRRICELQTSLPLKISVLICRHQYEIWPIHMDSGGTNATPSECWAITYRLWQQFKFLIVPITGLECRTIPAKISPLQAPTKIESSCFQQYGKRIILIY